MSTEMNKFQVSIILRKLLGFLRKMREVMTCGLSILFTKKAIIDDHFFVNQSLKLKNVNKRCFYFWIRPVQFGCSR